MPARVDGCAVAIAEEFVASQQQKKFLLPGLMMVRSWPPQGHAGFPAAKQQSLRCQDCRGSQAERDIV